jgi:predicted amino acid-binding ACT domain protein
VGAKEPGSSVGLHSIGDHTAINLKGADRRGLLSEIFAVLSEHQCNVLAAEMWTHRTRVACVVYVNDVATGQAIDDPRRMSRIEDRLRYLLRGYGGGDGLGALASFAVGPTSHVDRRLHQLMHADVDVDGPPAAAADGGEGDRPLVKVEHCAEKSYSVVHIKCKDRSKLLYDIVCTLTDMEYVVFHAAVFCEASYGVQVHTAGFGSLDLCRSRQRHQAALMRTCNEHWIVSSSGAVHSSQGRRGSSQRRSGEGDQVPGSGHLQTSIRGTVLFQKARGNPAPNW